MGFKKKQSREMPELSTSSLPDLIFTMLFFFMMVTTMREVTMQVNVSTPKGTELEKLENKSDVSFIYIGQPNDAARYGSATRVQVNDRILDDPRDIRDFIAEERASGIELSKHVVSIKADQNAQMGIVTDIKEQLRKAKALKLNYSAGQK